MKTATKTEAQLVCDFDLSKKLDELGFDFETSFLWEVSGECDYSVTLDKDVQKYLKKKLHAYSASELGQFLPHKIEIKILSGDSNEPIEKLTFNLWIGKNCFSGWTINYLSDGRDDMQLFREDVVDENYANAIAKILIKIYDTFEDVTIN